MKKNIIIGVMAILTILSGAFGFVERAEANRQREFADKNAQMAVQNMEMAREQLKQAEEHAIHMKDEADRQRKIAEECASKK